MPSNSELQKQMQSVISYMEQQGQIDLKIDTKGFNKSLSDMSSVLNKLKGELKNFGVIDSVVNEGKTKQSTKAIEEQTNAIKIQQQVVSANEKAIKSATVVKVDKNGNENIIKELSVIQDKYRQIVQTVDTFNAKTGEHTGTVITTTDETEKKRIADEKILKEESKILRQIKDDDLKFIQTINDKRLESDRKRANESAKIAQKIANEDNKAQLEAYSKAQALQSKMKQDLEKLRTTSQPKIDGLSSNDLISPNVITAMQAKLNSFNTDTATKEISDFKRELQNLGSSQPSIVRLQNAITNLTRDMGLAKNKYGSLVSKEDTAKSVEEINKLKNALKDITGGKNISSISVTKSINEASSSVKNLTANAKESAQALRMTNNEAMSLGQSLSSALSKFGVYASMAMAVRGLFNEIKNGIGYVNEMNKSMTNIQMITGKNKEEVQGLTDSYKDLASEMSATNAETVKGAENFLRAGYDNSSTKEMIKQNIIGSKISGQGQGENSEQIIAIKNAYDMQAESISHVNDVLSTLDDTSSTSYAEMAKILQYSAFAGKEAKVSFEELSTYASTVSSTTRLSAESIGNALFNNWGMVA